MTKPFICIAALLLTGVFLIPSCTKEYLSDPDGVCFERDVQPILVNSCAFYGCHDAASKTEGYDFSTYESILNKGVTPGNYRESDIYQAITRHFGENAMPPSPYNRLTEKQIATIALWIEEGALNTTCEVVSCDTLNMSFSADVLPILENNCNSCHSGSAPSAGIDLSTYDGVKPFADGGNLVGVISHAPGFLPMPDGGGKLPDCQIAQISAWVNGGAPNN